MADILSRLRGRDVGLQEAILMHVQELLRARPNTSRPNPDYGLAELISLTNNRPEACHVIYNSIAHAIETYEPRMTAVRLLLDEHAEGLSFKIQGVSANGQAIHLRASLNADCGVSLSLSA